MSKREELVVNQLTTPTGTRIKFGTAVPTGGTHRLGDIILNTSPVADAALGWRCTVAGTPGTFVAMFVGGAAAVTATSAEINSLTNLPATVTTTGVAATGTNAVQFAFKDSAGAALNHAISGRAYFSTVDGLAIAAVTGAVVLTNGVWSDDTVGTSGHFITTATGLLGLTVTAPTGSYYLSFVLPNGKIITSTVLTVN